MGTESSKQQDQVEQRTYYGSLRCHLAEGECWKKTSGDYAFGNCVVEVELRGTHGMTGLKFDDLMHCPKTEVASVHQCCGNPFEPFELTRRVCNVRWGGARLGDVLAGCRGLLEWR